RPPRKGEVSAASIPPLLRQPIGDVVVITVVLHEDVLFDVRARRLPERTHPNRNDVVLDRVPKQKLPAHRTAPAPHLLRRLIPGELVGTLKRQRIALHIGRCPIVPRLLAALRAMTGIGRMKLALHRKPHRAAEARTVVFHRKPPSPRKNSRKNIFYRINISLSAPRPNTNASPHIARIQSFNPLQRNADGTSRYPLQRNAVRCIYAKSHPMRLRPHAASRLPGRKRTSRCLGPEMKFDASHSGSPTIFRSSIRVSTSRRIASISMRAMCWPRQPCGPVPKAMCSLGVRERSSRSGASNFAASRLAEPKYITTLSRSRIFLPESSVSCFAYRSPASCSAAVLRARTVGGLSDRPSARRADRDCSATRSSQTTTDCA